MRFPPGRGHDIFQGAYRDWLVRAMDPQTGSGTFEEPASACTSNGVHHSRAIRACACEIADRRSALEAATQSPAITPNSTMEHDVTTD